MFTRVALIACVALVFSACEKTDHESIDKWQNTSMAGVPGDYYLVYLGRDTPAAWPFALYRDRLVDGMTFQVDVIDTWNMTITPLDTHYMVKRKDRYTFVDQAERAVPLPERPGTALRIRYVSGPRPQESASVPVEP